MASVVDDATESMFGYEVFGTNAAEDASVVQQESADAAIKEHRAARDQAREDLSPFRAAGEQGINPLLDAVLRPKDPTSDPLFKNLFENATREITASNASRGKLHSGDTLVDLTKASAGIGAGIQGQRVNQLLGLVGMGQNSAAGSGMATLSTAGSISDLLTQKGNSKAAGILAPGQINRELIQSGINAAAMAAGGGM